MQLKHKTSCKCILNDYIKISSLILHSKHLFRLFHHHVNIREKITKKSTPTNKKLHLINIKYILSLLLIY